MISIGFKITLNISGTPGSIYFGEYIFSEVGITPIYLIDKSGKGRHFTFVGGVSNEFRYGFALQNGVKYAWDPFLEEYTGLNVLAFYTTYPPFSVEAEQFFLAPANDSSFILLDTENRFYDEETNPRPFAWQDISDLITSYLEIIIIDNVITDVTITGGDTSPIISSTILKDLTLTTWSIDTRLNYLARTGVSNITIDIRGNSIRSVNSDAAILTLTNNGCIILEDNQND